jgi:hypothetical protein
MYKFFTCLLLLGLLSSCASIVNGTSQKVKITTTPTDCKVEVINNDGESIKTISTPGVLKLDRSDGFFQGADYLLKINKTGFDEMELHVTSSTSGWYWAGNFVFGGLIGWLILDPATGGMWTLSPEKINTKMLKGGKEVSSNDLIINIIMKEKIAELGLLDSDLIRMN